MKQVAYYFTSEVAEKYGLKNTDLRVVARLMKVWRIEKLYMWKEEDLRKLERILA